MAATRADAAEPAYPRTLGLYLQHGALPSAASMARYDVVVIDNEWAHRQRPLLDEVRRLNPSIRLLAYVNLVDRPLSLGGQSSWRNRWSLWGYTAANSIGTFPEPWIAKTAGGAAVSEWAGTWMTNLSDTAPLVGGKRFYEYAAHWTVDNVWASGAWDGIFLDVWGDRIWNSAATNWDVDRDGDNDSGAALYGAGSPWERGITAAEQIMRSRMGPGAILVANNTRTFRDGLIDGRLWESFADPGKGRSFAVDGANYVAGVRDAGHAQPGVQLTLNKEFSATGGATDERRARYFLTASLMSNGYWGGSVGDYSGFGWHEEFHGAGLGRGYLGQPLAANPTWSQITATYATSAGVGKYANGVHRRDFTNGIALVNPTGSPQTVSLETSFDRLSGASSVNTGGAVQTITIPSLDGIILMRQGSGPASPPSSPPPAPAPAPVTVSVSPSSVSVPTGDARTFSASTSNGSGVSWSVNGVAGGNATVGRITSGGVYTAPATVPSGTVTVRATHSGGTWGQAAVTVTARLSAPAPSPAPAPSLPRAPETPLTPAPVLPAPAPKSAPRTPSPSPSPAPRPSSSLFADGFEGGALTGSRGSWSALTTDAGATASAEAWARRAGSWGARFSDLSRTARSAYVSRTLSPVDAMTVRADLRISALTLGRDRTRTLLSVGDARGAGHMDVGVVRERSGALRWATWTADRTGRRGAIARGGVVTPGAWSRVEFRTTWLRRDARGVLLVNGTRVATGAPLDLAGRRAGRVEIGLVDSDVAADTATVHVDGVVVIDPDAGR